MRRKWEKNTFFGIDGDKKDFISKKSIYNQAYSDLITSLEDQIEQNGLTVHCFYAQKMGKNTLNDTRNISKVRTSENIA